MVVIECPHCSDEIEMDDDSYGLFECPSCGGEYEWGEEPKTKISKSTKKTDFSKLKKRSNSNKKTVKTAPIESAMLVEPNQILMTMFTVLMMVIILAGLNSDFWYKVSYSTYDEWDDNGRDIETGWSFSSSTTVAATTYEDIEVSTLSSSDFSYQIEYAELAIENMEDYCRDWGDSEEAKEYCDEALDELQESLDSHNSWNNAGTFLWIFIMLGLLCSIAIILLNFFAILDDYKAIHLPENIYDNYSKINTILNLVLPSLLIIGCILYWIMAPDPEAMIDEVPDDFSSGPGMIWWVTVIISIGYIIKPAITLTKERF